MSVWTLLLLDYRLWSNSSQPGARIRYSGKLSPRSRLLADNILFDTSRQKIQFRSVCVDQGSACFLLFVFTFHHFCFYEVGPLWQPVAYALDISTMWLRISYLCQPHQVPLLTQRVVIPSLVFRKQQKWLSAQIIYKQKAKYRLTVVRNQWPDSRNVSI